MKITSDDLRQRLLPILCSQAVGLACGVVGVRLTSQLVDPVDYGVYGVFVSLASIGVAVVYAGLIKFVSRNWQGSTDRPGLTSEVLAATLRKTPWLLAACVGATLLAAPGHKMIFAGLLFASAFLLALTQLAQSALQAAREHWRDLGLAASVSVTRSFAPPLLYRATGAGLTALLFGFLLQSLVGVLLGAVQLRRWWRGARAESSTRILTPIYDGPRFVILAIAAWILAGMNRWLVAWLFGAETAGYFNLASNLGYILPNVFGMVILQYVQPQWFALVVNHPEARRQLLREVDRVALIYTVLALGLVAAVNASMPLLVGPLVSVRYLPATAFMLMTGCSTVSLTIGVYYHVMLLAARRERACSTADLGGAACLIIGSVVSAGVGLSWFKGWLVFSPVVPWVVNRTLARRSLLAPA